jgi:hypothetical protein
MKLSIQQGIGVTDVTVTLSERNVRELVESLDYGDPVVGIWKRTDFDVRLSVRVEDDATHYGEELK